MSRFTALFLPVIAELCACGGVLLFGSGMFIAYIAGTVLCVTAVLAVVYYARELRRLPDVPRIDTPAGKQVIEYMHGGLIVSFMPTAAMLILSVQLLLAPNDGVSLITFVPVMLLLLAVPFLWEPWMVIGSFGSHRGTVWAVIIVGTIIRVIMQSMCYFATNKRIDYSNDRISAVLLTIPGTVNVIFWLGCLSKVRKFARIEADMENERE